MTGIEYGVRWESSNGLLVDAWGYTQTGAERIVAIAHGKAWSPVAASVISRSVGAVLTGQQPNEEPK